MSSRVTRVHPARRAPARAALLVTVATLMCAAPTPAAPTGLLDVMGRACVPNAFQPALPCTLRLSPPGDRLAAPGIVMFAEPAARADSVGEFGYLPFGAWDYAFDQVNVFWHAQQHLARFARWGLDPAEMPVLLHVVPGAGSFTNLTEPITTIGTGVGTQDRGAKDSDVIVHEITHAVFNPRLPLGVYPFDKGEAVPLLEGLADYYAAAVNGDTRMGEFAHPPDGYHDIASDPAVYRYDRWDLLPGDPYARGRVLNGALLEIRATLGEKADELVFRALEHAPLRCFTCFADAVRWADLEHEGGAHLSTIDAAFRRRAIPFGGPPVDLGITVPAYAWVGDTVTARIRHSCGAGPFAVDWWLRDTLGVATALADHGEVARFTMAGAASLGATFRDQFGTPFTLAEVPIAALDPADPSLRVTGVRIEGPASLTLGLATRYVLRLTGGAGVPPASARWTVEGATTVVVAPDGSEVMVTALADPVRLRVDYRDAIGQAATDTLTVPAFPRPIIDRVGGPLALEAGQVGTYVASVRGGSPPFTHEWRQVGPLGAVPLPDSVAVRSLPATEDFLLTLVVRDARGARDSTARTVQIVEPLRVIGLAGPGSVREMRAAVYRAQVVGGLRPFRYEWTQGMGASAFVIGRDSIAATAPSVSAFTVAVAVRDARDSVASASRVILVEPALGADAIRGPSDVVEGRGAVFHVVPSGGLAPYRYRWMQFSYDGAYDLGTLDSATTRGADRDFRLTVWLVDSMDSVFTTTRDIHVVPAGPPPAPRVFRAVATVVRRGGFVAFELPEDARPAGLEILDVTGRRCAEGRIPGPLPASLDVRLPDALGPGVYFARLRRDAGEAVVRLLVLGR